MIDPASYERLKQEIAERIEEDYGILEQLCHEECTLMRQFQ